ncbi:MAG: tRNA preQ1(34) S-adenosylmethionine ribosyltransferase-isomerase QueA [Verrucomicrobiota bacterium]
MHTADFNYDLPSDLISQRPPEHRDQSRLLLLNRLTEKVFHRHFSDLLQFLKAGDVLVLNNSRVIPARLRGMNPKTGGKLEILLVKENQTNDWWAMLRPGKRAPIGTRIDLSRADQNKLGIFATVADLNAEGHRRLCFSGTKNVFNELDWLGEVPLPPYIERAVPLAEDRERYQTVYASQTGGMGSVAAPTAGLHFTNELLETIKLHGVEIHQVTLHVGLGTFAPVKTDSLIDHVMHEEHFEISRETATAINKAKTEQRRVIAVGTTTVRTLESVARKNCGALVAANEKTKIFIYPPCQFQIVDALITNFHLPSSTLLMLVSAFTAPGETRGRDIILSAYQKAIEERYRFFSYGDAMLIL